ncbi:lipopolysaccharide-induced tumor necrosis factor-alpha factor homolog [Stegastes partitus]|uniref:Lipopolysaccharide-induced tumor necrosis factor-alpha factor homolog n=1 Tax=Stegastes partitus TaxID=144197 RepID=A0A9Y4NSB3_9TELE|nr:PREDICTED: cell death-inducing p53-target protein 1 [Stegastes partitus]
MQQLLERKKFLCILKELRDSAEFGQREEAVSTQKEIDSVDVKLKQLSDRKATLQKSYDNILNAKHTTSKKEVSFASSQKIETCDVPGVNVFYVEAPPNFPAPTVILDLEKLPAHPCRTQCPECREFIMTETFTSVSSLTWLVCFMTAVIGCVAGCCLIPFCVDSFKSITHRCPKCRTSLKTLKKL